MSTNELATTKQNLPALPDEELKRYQANIARLRTLVQNGRKLSDEQVQALGIFSARENLDPMIGECYMMVDKDGKTLGPVVGVKGAQRKAQEQLGPGEVITTFYRYVNPPSSSAKALVAVECELRDTVSVRKWGEMYKSLASANMPPAMIIDAIGPAPKWIGTGLFLESERSDYKDAKYSPSEKAKKRALVSALKQRFSLNYKVGDNGEGGPLAVEGEYVDAESVVYTDASTQEPEPTMPVDPQTIIDELMGVPAKAVTVDQKEVPLEVIDPIKPLYTAEEIAWAENLENNRGEKMSTFSDVKHQKLYDNLAKIEYPDMTDGQRNAFRAVKILLGLPQ